MIGDKVVVFSQCLKTLDFIESIIKSPDWGRTLPGVASLSPGRIWGSWRSGQDYLRMDGTTTASERGVLINQFNDEKSNKTKSAVSKAEETAKLFLISSKAGSVG